MNAIFIGGCPRSGTTMLGSILGANKDCFVTPESQFKKLFVYNELTIKDIERELGGNFHLSLWEIKNINLDNIEDKNKILPFLLNLYKREKKVPDSKNIWVDHSPDNFELFSTLLQIFPVAKFIHIIRDSRGVASSIIPLDWGPNDALEVADWWLQKASFGFSAEIFKPGNVFHVRYEDILLYPEKTIKDLCEKIEIEFSDDMLKGDNSFLPNYTKKQHTLVGNFPQKNQVNSWQQKLSKKELEILEKKTGPVLQNFDYEITHYGKLKINFLNKTIILFKRVFKRIVSKIRFRQRQKQALKDLF